MAQLTCSQYNDKIANLSREKNELIELKYKLMDENNKLRYDNIELKSKLMDENKLKKELDEIKQERDKLKRDKEIQKLGGLKLCYKN